MRFLTNKRLFGLLAVLLTLLTAGCKKDPAVKGNWFEVGEGDRSLNANSSISSICVDADGTIFAAGGFRNSTGSYVAKWDGNSWSGFGAPLSFSPVGNNTIMDICIDKSGNIYAAGWFTDATWKYYVAKWNRNVWQELGTGANALNPNSSIQAICVDNTGNVYAAGMFYDAFNRFYVSKWNGTTWTKLGGDTACLNANDYIFDLCCDNSGNVYAAGSFKNSNGVPYVAKWNGSAWTELGGPGNSLTGVSNGYINSIILDHSGNVYAGGWGMNVARWNGNTWAQLPGNNDLVKNGFIIPKYCDGNGTVFAALNYDQTNYHPSNVIKWNGSQWVRIGPGSADLNANGSVSSVWVDGNGVVYAAGGFTNQDGRYYVARYY